MTKVVGAKIGGSKSRRIQKWAWSKEGGVKIKRDKSSRSQNWAGLKVWGVNIRVTRFVISFIPLVCFLPPDNWSSWCVKIRLLGTLVVAYLRDHILFLLILNIVKGNIKSINKNFTNEIFYKKKHIWINFRKQNCLKLRSIFLIFSSQFA